MPTKSTHRQRNPKELDRKSRAYLQEVLKKEPAALDAGQLEFLKARSNYLTVKELEYYGIKAPKQVVASEGPVKDEAEEDAPSDEASDENKGDGVDGEEAASEDEETLDEDMDDVEEFADLDPDTEKPLIKPEKPVGKPKGKPGRPAAAKQE